MAAAYVKYGIAALSLFGFVSGMRMGDSLLAGFVVGLGGLWVGVALFFVLAGAFYVLLYAWRAASLLADGIYNLLGGSVPTIPRLLAVDDQELRPERNNTEVRGRVRAQRLLRSPLDRTSCVAFRLVGEGPVGEIDDAAGTDFVVVEDDGGEAEVRVGAASIALDVDARPRLVRPDARLERFLEERAVYPERGPVYLTQAVLRDGDPVIVEGACDQMQRPDGYRATRRVRVIRGRPHAPLVIRRRIGPGDTDARDENDLLPDL